MSARVDPFDVLVAMRPDVERSLDRPDVEARLDAIFARACAAVAQPAPAPTTRGRRRRRRGIVGGGLALVALGGSAAVAALVTHDDGSTASVSCWTDPAGHEIYETMVEPGRSPIDACARWWSDAPSGAGEVPAAVACTDEHGGLAVVPAPHGESCSSLGLDDASVPGASFDAAAELYRRLNVVLAEECSGEAATQALVDEVLSLPQFTGWTSSVRRRPSPEQPCGAVVVDVPTRTVTLIALPPSPDAGSLGAGSFGAPDPDRRSVDR